MKKNRKLISIVFGIICFILSFAIVIQAKSLKSVNSPFLKIETDNELRDELLSLKEKYDNTLYKLEKSEKNLEKIREKSVKNDSVALAKQDEIKRNNEILGLTDITGQGVLIIIKTNQIDNKLKEDMYSIINELKNSGAEAISINEERIIFNSSIICNENNIEVNGVIIQSPFEIKAIGDTKLIYNDLMRPGGYIELINDSIKKAEVTRSNKITIKKYSGNISSENMKAVI